MESISKHCKFKEMVEEVEVLVESQVSFFKIVYQQNGKEPKVI